MPGPDGQTTTDVRSPGCRSCDCDTSRRRLGSSATPNSGPPSRSDLGWGRASDAAEVRALAFEDVLHRRCDVFFLPQVPGASVASPKPRRFARQSCLAQTARCPGLECVHDPFGLNGRGYHHVHVIRANVQRPKSPATKLRDAFDGARDELALRSFERCWPCDQQGALVLFARPIYGQFAHSAAVAKALHRAIGVPVKASTIAGEGDEVGERAAHGPVLGLPVLGFKWRRRAAFTVGLPYGRI